MCNELILLVIYIHAQSIFTGDIFAVIVDPNNTKSVDYYLLRCTQPKCKLLESVSDDNGQQYPTSSIVVEGTYYQQIKIDTNGVTFIDYMPSQKVVHYNHLVIATRLQLGTLPKRGRGNQKWWFPIEDHEIFLEIIKDRVDPDYMYHEL